MTPAGQPGTILHTTLGMIRRSETFSECFSGFPCDDLSWDDFLDRIGRDTPEDKKLYPVDLLRLGVPIEYVLRGIGCIPKEQLPHAKTVWVCFACDCLERVLPLYEDEYAGEFEVRNAIQAARNFDKGRAAQDILGAARDAVERIADKTAFEIASVTRKTAAGSFVAMGGWLLANMARRAVRRERLIPARTAEGVLQVMGQARGARLYALPVVRGLTYAEQWSRERATAREENAWQTSHFICCLEAGEK